MINIINNINIFINLQSMVQYCYCLYFLNSKALVLFQYPFINYRLINRIGQCGPTQLSVSVKSTIGRPL